MSKKMMLLALAVASAAMFALPTVASATEVHVSTAAVGWTAASEAGTTTVLKTSTNSTVTCTSATGSGQFDAGSTTTGTYHLLFHGCKNNLGLNCTSGTLSTGTITVTGSYHLITVAEKKPGILMTGSGTGVTETAFADFSCFGVTVQVFGNGIIGTITSPECGKASKTATLKWTSTAHGTQADIAYTGTNYDLKTKIGSGSHHETSSMDAEATLTWNTEQTLNCT